ncbi:copper chaperone PCu(A)C [Microbacterium sp. UBA837]|uniref:copper chaperone PCu(A)C n=1 Tax=Microbacterium sp. UBA837 TaxID=1946956 RepID=UPI0025F34010|nr:copper chaperone PCu(A)C [Microbacterium sp. UBA837]
MNTRNSTRFGILLVAAALGLAGCASASPSTPATTEAESVTITDAWVKAADSSMSAAFGVLENSADSDATIVSVSSDASSMMELHEVVDDGSGSMVMQEKDGGFVIPAGGSLTLEPGGYHFMLMDLTAPLVAGEDATFTVTFDDGSTMAFVAPVKDFTGADENYNDGGMDMGDDHSGMDMGGDE